MSVRKRLWFSVIVSVLVGPAVGQQPCGEHVTPASVTLTLEPGDSHTLQKCICLDSVPPLVDIVFAVDLTGSMTGEANNLKTSIVNIMSTVRSGAPTSDVRFGLVTHEDYPAAYNTCSYATTYGSAAAGDEPFRVDAAVGASDAAVQAAIQAMTIKDGGDGPEAYSRVVWEAAQPDSGIAFRDGALRLLLMFGDSIPHDCQIEEGLLFVELPFDSTGKDPGRDEIANTADDIDWQSMSIPAALAANVRPVEVFSGSATNMYTAWQQWTAQMNGFARKINTDGTVPGSSLPNLILQIVKDASSTVKVLKLVPEPGCPLTITTSPTQLGPINVSTGANVCLNETISVPANIDPDLSPIQCFVDVLADGVLIAQQEVNVLLSVPPQCDAGGPYSGVCNGGLVSIALDGTGSFDPDGGTLQYAWSTNCAGATILNPTSPTATLRIDTASGAGCDLGCTVTLTLNDGVSPPEACSEPVSITDPTKPVLSGCSASGGNLDASGNRVVTFQATASDNCCINPNGVSVAVLRIGGGATLGTPQITKTQIDAFTVSVSGSVMVSNVTGCPVVVQVTVNTSDCCGNAATPCAVTANVSDVTGPTIAAGAVGGSVDATCKRTVTFNATVDDNACIATGNVGVTVALAGGAATLGAPQVNKVQTDGNTVTVTGSVQVSNVTVCPAVVRVTVDALDCCGNPVSAPKVVTADVGDTTAPSFTICPQDRSFPTSCDPTVAAWLNSATASDNCDSSVSVTPDITDCAQLQPGTSTIVTWTATDNCGNSSTCQALATIERGTRGNTSKLGSLLFFSKIELKWDAAGNLIQDTFLELSNDGPGQVRVQLFFINGDKPLPANSQTGERAHPGWNKLGPVITLSAEEPTYWSASEGQPKGVVPFNLLDPGFPPGRPDVEDPSSGLRVLRGYALAFAVGSDGAEIRWNYLSGSGMLMNFREMSAWEYPTWGFTALGDGDGEALGTPGVLDLNGGEYENTPGRLQIDFYRPGSRAFSVQNPVTQMGEDPALFVTGATGGAIVTVETDVTLFPISVDLRQDTTGPVTTFALYDIYDENENELSGTGLCITCWDQTLLRNYPAPNNFVAMHTNKGKARIRGVISSQCAGSVRTPVLGVAAKRLDFDSGVRVEWTGLSLGIQDMDSAVIRFDP